MLGMVGMADMSDTIQGGLDAAKSDIPVCVAKATDAEAVACNTALVAKAQAAFPDAVPIIDAVVSKLFDPIVKCAGAADAKACVEGTIDSAFNAALKLLTPANRRDIDPNMIAMVVDPAVTEFKTNLHVCYGQPNFDHCGVEVTLEEVNKLWNTYGSMLGMIGAADMATTAQVAIDAANADFSPVWLPLPMPSLSLACKNFL
ncbi:hypothetical protein SARC_12691 [Sphaeroforma arctica JP610]|uniref:Uncharacterized protein n=1 Tax=Sphaeroforma arctica JP610 TaxID=667725 RepID=A0A0L0FDE4_9EUKA|nr:hypothetical protein SARC_12691 [Sphaeroforma arctica JP610]KNC74770.1 hypothetical protein SARC_12691 [Sphaeroforma arctica JP610]|eukprot:XP_014148672.1 hypothetical protein SARC_12691 [Sphaeroforma arctica JP610]